MKALGNTIVLGKKESSQKGKILLPDNVDQEDSEYNTVVAHGPDVKGLSVGDVIHCDWRKVHVLRIVDKQYIVTDSTNTIVIL